MQRHRPVCGETNNRSRCALRVVTDGLDELDEDLGTHGRMLGVNEDPVEAEGCRYPSGGMLAMPIAVLTMVLPVQHKVDCIRKNARLTKVMALLTRLEYVPG